MSEPTKVFIQDLATTSTQQPSLGPCTPWGVQDEEGHGDDSSVAVLAGKLLEWNRLG